VQNRLYALGARGGKRRPRIRSDLSTQE